MPKMVKIYPNKAYKAKNPAEAAMLEAAIKTGPLEMPYATAMENIRLSGGMYSLPVPKPEPEPDLEPEPESDTAGKKAEAPKA